MQTSSFKVAVAQHPSVKGDIAANIRSHLRFIQAGADEGVDLMVFPELSLTGYEPELAAELALSADDQRLEPMLDLARERGITAVVGAPLKKEAQLPELSSLIISPKGMSHYSKIWLHPGEDTYFQPADQHQFLTFGEHKVGLAICADANNDIHPENCANAGAGIYLAGVMIGEGGYPADTANLARYAREHTMLVAMANHNRETGGWQPAGKSAIWSTDGMLAQADQDSDCLVIAEVMDGQWQARVVLVMSLKS